MTPWVVFILAESLGQGDKDHNFQAEPNPFSTVLPDILLSCPIYEILTIEVSYPVLKKFLLA
jgi:hypothetical protein